MITSKNYKIMEKFQELLLKKARTKVVHMVNKAKSVAIENELEEN